MGNLLQAEAQATIDSLKKAGCSVRVLRFEELTESILGELFAHFMLETIITAELIGVNAFNQPGVEESKELTRDYLLNRKAS